MATKPKAKNSVKSQASKSTKGSVFSSKKFSLSKKQWGIFGIVAVALLGIGTYFGIQQYQNTTADAAGWKTIYSNLSIGFKGNNGENSTALVKVLACKLTKGSTIAARVKVSVNSLSQRRITTVPKAKIELRLPGRINTTLSLSKSASKTYTASYYTYNSNEDFSVTLSSITPSKSYNPIGGGSAGYSISSLPKC